MPKQDPAAHPPCKHMEELLQQQADGTLRGPKAWFVKLHILHCKPCGRFLRSLKSIVDRLRGSKPDPGEADALARLREKIASGR